MINAEPLTLTLSPEDINTRDRVLLEQEPWDPYVGMLTKGGVVVYLYDLLFGEEDNVSTDCGVDEYAGVSGVVYAYPDPKDLNYHIGISHSDPGEPIITELQYSELLQVQNEKAPILRYPTDEIISAEWITDAFTVGGQPLPRPIIHTSGGKIRISEAVYGTILVIYKVVRHTYSVYILPRPTAIENKYQSYVYAVWDGGNNYLEYEPPKTVEDGGDCNLSRHGEGDISTPEDCEPPLVSPEDVHYDVDYCSGKVF